MKKRISLLFTALCLCLTLLPTAAFAAGEGGTGEAPHKHCVCGATHTAVGDHKTVNEQTFTKWNDDDALPSQTGYYYLDTDVTLNGVWIVDENVVLCLNGHTITLDEDPEGQSGSCIAVYSTGNLTVTDCKTGTAQGKITHKENVTGYAVSNEGTFNMYGGVICGNTSNNHGGGVYLHEGSTFYMYGGEISGNTAEDCGGGVYLYEKSTFHMYGGTIKDNTARRGGGVYVLGTFNMSGTATVTKNTATDLVSGVYVAQEGDKNGKMTVGGSAKVWGNTFNDLGSLIAYNIALSDGSYITLNSDPLTSDAKFGIYPHQEEAYTAVQNIGDYKDHFTSDWARYELVVDGTDLKMQKKERYIVVNNTEITDANAADVLGDGSVKYDKATKTLTLTNANINKGYNSWYTSEVGIYAEVDSLTVDLVGNNFITMPAGTAINESYGIYAYANDLTIQTSSGSGSLTVTTTDALSTYGISLYGDLTVEENVTLHVTGGTAHNAANYANSYGIAARNVTIGKNAKVISKAGKIESPYARDSMGLYASENVIVKDGAEVTATGGTITATYDGYPYSVGIYAYGYISIGNARVIATGGDVTDHNCCSGKASSCGLDARAANGNSGYFTSIRIADGATVIATGGKVTSVGTEENYSGAADSSGIYSRLDMVIGKATVTATAGEANGQYYAHTYGIWHGYITKSDGSKVAGKLIIADGATVTATGGKATTQNAGATGDDLGRAYSYGVFVRADITVGQDAKLTAKAKDVNGQFYSYSEGIYVGYVYNNNAVYGNMTIADGAAVTVTAGNATSRNATSNSATRGAVGSEAIYISGGTLTIGKATVTAATGKVSAVNSGISTSGYNPLAENIAVLAYKLTLEEGGKLTVTAGDATCVDPLDSSKTGKYVDASSYGLYIGYEGMEIAGTLVATGGDAYGRCDKYTDNTTSYGGWVRTYGAVCYGTVIVKDDANIKFAAGNATAGGDSVDNANVSSNGLWISRGFLQMDGGAVYVKSGTATGGDFDTDGLSIWHYSSVEDSGKLVMNAGWLKVETNDVAILAEKGIELGGTVTVHTPENGAVDTYNKYDTDCYTIVNKDGERAAAVLLWDGTTEAYTEPASNSGGGSSSNTSSTTTKNPDGSTTTTTTNKKTGEVTETTTAENGTSSTVVTDQEGNVTEISANVPASAAKDGETVTLPIHEVEAADSENAQEITVNVPSGGATVEIPVKNPTPGTVVVIVDEDGTETVIPGAKITENGIEVTLTEGATIKIVDNSKAFDDVKETDYFRNAVAWAYSRGITGGTSANTFGPHESCTRAQLVTFLWKAAGQPEAKGESGFADVSADTYYAKAVAWAFEKGIVSGYGEGLFGSDDTITREQMAVILYRFAQSMGMDTTQGGMQLREFKDYESISGYAVAAVQWAVNAGVMAGSEGSLMPGQPCTRAQIVTMLYSLLGK